MGTWTTIMLKWKIRKTLVVSLLPLICSFLHSTFNDQRSWYWLHLRMNPQVCVFTQLDSCRLKNDKTTKRTTEAESTKSFFLPLVSLRQTWHKSLEWLHENKMNHTTKLKWTTTKSIIYLIKELPHTIWRSLAPGPAGKHFNSHCGDAFIKITTTIPALPELICYKQS